jgi:hypothetical protein
MRLVSRSDEFVSRTNVFPIRPGHAVTRDDPKLTAFRGLLIAGSVSLLFWGVCLAALWVIRTRP